MADIPEKKVSEAQEQTRVAAKGLAQNIADTTQRGGAAAHQASQASAEVLRRTARSTAEAIGRGAEAGAQALHRVNEGIEDGTREEILLGTEWQQRLFRTAAEQWERTAQTMAKAFQHTADDMQALIPTWFQTDGTRESVQEWHQGISSIVRAVIESNVKAAQEVFRAADPTPVIRLQRRLARTYVEAVLQGSTTLVRTTQLAAERTLRPLEEQIEQIASRRFEEHDFDWQNGRVIDVMQREVRAAKPDDTVQQVAQLMRAEDTGVLPVSEGDRLVGMVTDRDVALRLVAEGRDPERTKVREVMTPDVPYVFEDEDLSEVAETMSERQVRRLPVLDRQQHLVGVVSLSDLARKARAPRLGGHSLGRTTRAGDLHTQSAAE